MHASAHQITEWWTPSNTPSMTQKPETKFSILSKGLNQSVLLALDKPIFFCTFLGGQICGLPCETHSSRKCVFKKV
jgi:hypothetical protein